MTVQQLIEKWTAQKTDYISQKIKKGTEAFDVTVLDIDRFLSDLRSLQQHLDEQEGSVGNEQIGYMDDMGIGYYPEV